MFEFKYKYFIYFVLIFFSGSLQANKPLVSVGAKADTENLILSEVAARIIEQTGLDVERKFNWKSSQELARALKQGKIDVYTDTTGSLAFNFLKDSSLKSWKDIQEAMAKKGFVISPPLGFDNSYALAMEEVHAYQMGIREISDLKNYPEIKAAFGHEFLKGPQGLPDLLVHYGIGLAQAIGMELDKALDDWKSGELDLIGVSKTDGHIENLNLFFLDDDKKFFPENLGVFVTRTKFVKAHPQIWYSLVDLEEKLGNEMMRRLNALVDVDGQSITEAAAIFLGSSAWIKLAEKKNQNVEEETKVMSGSNKYAQDPYWKRLMTMTGEHLLLVFGGLLLSILFGFPLGFIAAVSKRFNLFIFSFINVFQAIPVLALMCFFIPFLGIGFVSSLSLVFLVGLLPIVRHVYLGFKVRGKGVHLRDFRQPEVSRKLFSGVQKAAVINVGTTTLAAFIGGGGYGSFIVTGLAINDIQLVLRGAIPAATMGILVQWLFEYIEVKIVPNKI